MMQFQISTSFTTSLPKLSSGEQTAVRRKFFNLKTNPKCPGLKMHRLEGTWGMELHQLQSPFQASDSHS